MVTPEYLQQLRIDSCMSWSELSKATGHPVSTIRDHVSGKVAKPNPAILVSIVGAMGGDPTRVADISAEMREDLAEIRKAADEDRKVKSTVDTMRRVRGEMLENQKEYYEDKIESLKESHAREVAILERTSNMRLKLCYLLASVLFVVMLAVIGILVFDISCHDKGWFTAAAAVHMIGGLL